MKSYFLHVLFHNKVGIDPVTMIFYQGNFVFIYNQCQTGTNRDNRGVPYHQTLIYMIAKWLVSNRNTSDVTFAFYTCQTIYGVL